MAEIIIGAGHELVPVTEVPKLIALARHGLPARYPLEEPEEEDGPLTYDLSIWNDVLRIEDERGHRKDLFSAASRGEVRLVTSPGRRPTTWGHHAHLTIDALTVYVAQFGVTVKIAPNEEPAEAVTVVTTDEHRENAEAPPSESVPGETKLQRAARRYDRFLALGGILKKAGAAWHAAGERGAIAKLEREEKAAGAPRSDKSDLRRELHAEHERRMRPV